jgi:hypothetical protein
MTAAKTKKNRPRAGSAEEAQAIQTLLRLTAGAGGLIRSPAHGRKSHAVAVKDLAGEDMLAQFLTKPGDTPPWE